MIDTIWLTTNRRCNFRCLWCYAEGTEYSKDNNMSHETAQRLVNIGLGIGAKSFILLGGEPTLWPHLCSVCRYLTECEVEATIVTNGWRFADKDFAKEVKDTGVSVNISLKAGNPIQYRQLTKVSAYGKTLLAIRNLVELGIAPSVTITANALVMDNLEQLVKVAFDSGARSIVIEFCSATFDDKNKPQQGYMLSPKEMAGKIMQKYDLLDRHSNGNLGIMQTLPFCLFPGDFIRKLHINEHLISGCHVIGRSGVVFTHDGAVLLCNCLYGFELGKLDMDFNDAETFNMF